MIRVLIADPLAKRGQEVLRQAKGVQVDEKTGLPEAELLKIVAEYDAVIVRSETKINKTVIDAAKKLKVVGRAGVGVDNVDVDAATKRGVIVMNTPSGNTISTAEHTFSMLMAMARNIPQAHASVKAGKWNRKQYQGVELYNKTLGIVGMGRIGSEVARRAIAFGMRVLAYDPYLSMSRAKSLQVELIELDDLLPQSDFITVHMPLTDETKGIINTGAFGKMKQGVRILNCARGGLIVEKDLIEAIKSGKVAGAALDVFEAEPLPADSPLRGVDSIILTPHLGASTAEAQESVGVEIAHSVLDALTGGVIRNAVNMPSLDAKTLALLMPYLKFGSKLGRLVSQLAPKRIEHIVVTYSGKASELDTNPITRYILLGFLESVSGKDINQVNAPILASNLGIKVEEIKSAESIDYAELIHVAARIDGVTTSVAGTFYGSLNNPRIVRINDLPVEAVPEGVLFLFENKDRPGVVGWIGTIMGKHKVNIAGMSLARQKQGGTALTVLNLDSVPSPELIAEISREKDIQGVKVAKL
ncbi:MAG: phosphoglycerate dehydrogenase [Verrucomicrobiae bacterium]|nr:phosphoglycerate dehydrogenase [Verrucomicrobiae bacterium]